MNLPAYQAHSVWDELTDVTCALHRCAAFQREAVLSASEAKQLEIFAALISDPIHAQRLMENLGEWYMDTYGKTGRDLANTLAQLRETWL